MLVVPEFALLLPSFAFKYHSVLSSENLFSWMSRELPCASLKVTMSRPSSSSSPKPQMLPDSSKMAAAPSQVSVPVTCTGSCFTVVLRRPSKYTGLSLSMRAPPSMASSTRSGSPLTSTLMLFVKYAPLPFSSAVLPVMAASPDMRTCVVLPAYTPMPPPVRAAFCWMVPPVRWRTLPLGRPAVPAHMPPPTPEVPTLLCTSAVLYATVPPLMCSVLNVPPLSSAAPPASQPAMAMPPP